MACNCTEINRIARIVDELHRASQSAKAAEASLPMLSRFADKWWVILIAYVMVIFPWGIIYNFDFITEKWRTVRHTRNLGLFHLAVAFVPMPFIIFYAHLQNISKDYKEMMTAVIAILMSLYHVMRTTWGLMQLNAFSRWCSRLMKRMRRMDMLSTYEAGLGRAVRLNANLIVKNLNTNLRVNNTIVDNEVTGTDLAVGLSPKRMWWNNPSRWLKTGESNLCAVRWSGAFLSAFGKYFSGLDADNLRTDELLNELFRQCSSSLGTLKHVTFPVNGKKHSFSVVQWRAGGPYNGEAHGFGMSSAPYFLNVRKRELENLMNGYPTINNRREQCPPDMRLVHAIQFAQCLNEEAFNALADYNSQLSWPRYNSGWALLLWQNKELPADEGSRISLSNSVPAFPWGKLMLPLWDRYTNWRVLQATAHTDIRTCSGVLPHVDSKGLQPGDCFYEHVRQKTKEHTQELNCLFVGSVLEMVRTFLADWVSSPSRHSTIPNWCPVLPTGICEFSIKQDITFAGDTMDRQSRDLWIWECQSALQNKIAKMDKSEVDLPASLELILLFLLSCPGSMTHQNDFYLDSSSFSDSSVSYSMASHQAINYADVKEIVVARQDTANSVNYPVEETNEDHAITHLLEFEVPIAPQDIKVSIQIHENKNDAEKHVEIDLISGDTVACFHWQDWINSIMGWMKGIDEKMIEEGMLTDNWDNLVNWRKRTPSKVDLSRSMMTIDSSYPNMSGLLGHIRVWIGWPFFDIKIVQFEMNQWMRGAGYLNANWEVKRPRENNKTFSEEVERAEEGLMEIMEWNMF